uniref:Uncharacterized protein n=1 Tax=Sphaerodactylus townsendi TaxID=933632 RepID=A0ACB8F5Z0_9SAUR
MEQLYTSLLFPTIACKLSIQLSHKPKALCHQTSSLLLCHGSNQFLLEEENPVHETSAASFWQLDVISWVVAVYYAWREPSSLNTWGFSLLHLKAFPAPCCI